MSTDAKEKLSEAVDKARRETKAEAEPKEKAARSTCRAPVLIEAAQTLSQVIVIAVGVTTALLSVIVGANLFVVMARSGAAVLALGFLLWAFNWLVAQGALKAFRAQMDAAKKRARRAADSGSRVELEA